MSNGSEVKLPTINQTIEKVFYGHHEISCTPAREATTLVPDQPKWLEEWLVSMGAWAVDLANAPGEVS